MVTVVLLTNAISLLNPGLGGYQLTGFRIGVAIPFSAVVVCSRVKVLLLRIAKGQGVGCAGKAACIMVSQSTITAAFLRAFW